MAARTRGSRLPTQLEHPGIGSKVLPSTLAEPPSAMDEKSQNASYVEDSALSTSVSRKTPLKADELAEIKLSTSISNNVDYSGAAGKTDPVEIKLVRKLDLWIMPMCVSSYHH